MTSEIRHSRESAEALEDFHYRHVYETELILSKFARSVHEAMVKTGKTQKDIAALTKKSPQSVSRALGAEQNLTVSKMVELSLALGCRVDLSVSKDPGIIIVSDKSFGSENVTTFDVCNARKPGNYIFEDPAYITSFSSTETKIG